MHIHSELMKVSMHIINTVIQFFFKGIRYFNPSQKYFSTTLITSMSSVIHQILLKKLKEISEVLLTNDVWSNKQMSSEIGVCIHFISN